MQRQRAVFAQARIVLAVLVATSLAGVLVIAPDHLPGPGPAAAQDTDFTRPQRHFRVENPASLSEADAITVYHRIARDIQAGYVLSRDPAARSYRAWRRFNRAPYRSATHGDRFVNNYTNPVGAEAYGRFEAAGEMPVGTVVAKDSFAVTARGDVFTGPLFLMEKMADGFNPASRDWKYSMIMPDGSYFGVTKGDNAERVEFCISCHERAGAENDHLFFVPDGNRLRAFKLESLAR